MKDEVMVIDCVKCEEVTDFTRLSPDLQFTLTAGLDDRFLQAPGGGDFTSSVWFHLDARPGGVWFAKGGYTNVDGNYSYWVGLYRKGQRKPAVVYGRELGKGHKWSPEIVTVNREGTRAASVDRLGAIHVWDTRDGTPLRIFEPARHVRFWNVSWDSPDRIRFGRRPFGSDRYRVNRYSDLTDCFDLTRRTLVAEEQPAAKPDPATTFDTSGDSLSINTGRFAYEYSESEFGRASCFRAWDLPGQRLQKIVVAGSRNGKLVAMHLRPDGTIRVLRRFHGHHAMVTAVSLSPNAVLLASSSIDGTIRLWDMRDLRDTAGDVDFEVKGTQVLKVPRNSESARHGIAEGDQVLSLGNQSFYASRESLIRRLFEPGHEVTLRLKNPDRGTYQVRNYRLQPCASHVEPLLSLLVTKDDDWILWSPRGYYDASSQGDRFISWHVNRGRKESAQVYKARQFQNELYRPLVIDNIFRMRDPDRAIALEREGPPDLRVSDRLARVAPPLVKILYPRDGLKVTNPDLNLLVEVTPQTDAEITEIRVEVNGLGGTEKGAEIIAARETKPGQYTEPVHLRPGINRISVTARTMRSESQPAIASITYTPRESRETVRTLKPARPRLFVLAVGVSNYQSAHLVGLDYAHRDAEDFLRAWEGQTGLYDISFAQMLRNEQATSSAVRRAIDDLLDAKPSPEDLVVMLFSGHGLYDRRGNYFLATHNADPKSLRETGIPHTEVTHLMNEDLKHCRRLLFVDACYSGDAVAAGARGEPWRKTGGIVFASSCWRVQSLEHRDWQNGAFTEAFLEAIYRPATGADPARSTVGDDELSAMELGLYFDKRITELTHQRQEPSMSWPPNIPDFPIAIRKQERRLSELPGVASE